jgi:hypothetical protein
VTRLLSPLSSQRLIRAARPNVRAAGVRALRRLRPHWVPLAIVLLASGVAQAATLVQAPLVWQWPDTVQYLANARHILDAHQFFDAWRTPGYPAFLALIFALTGGEHLKAVVLAQAVLIVAATLGIYVLVYRISARRWLAAVLGAAAGLDPFAVNWERSILTEVLTYALLVALFLVFERALRRERATTLTALALLCVAIILVRPQFLFLPIALALVMAIRSARLGSLARRWKALVLPVVLSYTLIVGYMGANAISSGYFGLSDVANLNLFGKMLEYGMYRLPDAGSNPRFARFQADVTVYMATNRDLHVMHHIWAYDVWHFVFTHPKYDADHWAIYGAYSMALIEHHPLYYLQRTSADVQLTGYAHPELWSNFSYAPGWFTALWAIFSWLARVYAFLPILLLASAIWAWRRPAEFKPLVLFALLLTVAANVVMTGAGDFIQFWRLRFPVDWAMSLAFAIMLVDLIQALTAALAKRRGTLKAPSAPLSASAKWSDRGFP